MADGIILTGDQATDQQRIQNRIREIELQNLARREASRQKRIQEMNEFKGTQIKPFFKFDEADHKLASTLIKKMKQPLPVPA